MFNTGNPAFNESTFDQFGQNYTPGGGLVQTRDDTMTVAGSIWKSLLLLMAVVAAGTITWGITMSGASPMPWVLGGALGGFAVALVIIFKPTTAPFLAPVYAVLEGLFLGAISAIYEARFGNATAGGMALNGIVVQAVGLTFGVTAAMLILYATRIITVTAKLRAGIMAATGGVVIFYVISLVLSFFMPTPWITSASPLSIGISLVIIAIAAFNLLLDFDLIEKGSAAGAPKYMEWYAAFGLLVTLVWLYLEILRLLAKFQSRD